MAHHYEIRKKNLLGEEDEILTRCEKKEEIPYELTRLGFGDCKTKLDEQGTLLYYKGKNVIYVAYVGNY